MWTRLNIVVVAFLVVLGSLMLVIVHDRRVMVGPPLAAVEGATVVQALPPEVAVAPIAVAPIAVPAIPLAATEVPAPVTTPVAAPVAMEDKSKYTAQWGDTVSNLAAEMPGGDRKANRDAVINANASLQSNPDRLLAGTTYDIPANASAPAITVPVAAQPAPVVAVTPVAASERLVPVAAPAATAPPTSSDDAVHQLKYVARAGDTVTTLAAALLGSGTNENRDAIVAANPSLQNDPDMMVDGRTYRIPVRESQPLSAAPMSEMVVGPRPSGQPDADDVVEAGSARELRYTARPGDTVSTLAVALLGSDTKENRAAIINNNKSLEADPDHVVAGQTYWITAPTGIQG